MRFLNPDPSGFGGGDTNLYRYEGNSPTNFVDPMGLASIRETPCRRARSSSITCGPG
jgi:uncharacterized protein RhaS with RHS repeats